MLPIYILLIIIAVGVLLLSDDGKALLKNFWLLLVIIVVGIIAFYLVVGGVAFFQTDSFQKFYKDILPWIFLCLMVLYWIYWLPKNFNKIVDNIKKSWIEKRGYSISVIALLLLIIFCWIIVPVLLS